MERLRHPALRAIRSDDIKSIAKAGKDARALEKNQTFIPLESMEELGLEYAENNQWDSSAFHFIDWLVNRFKAPK